MLTSGESGKRMIETQFCLTAADKQKYTKTNKTKTWQLDQTNISITHIWKQDKRTNFGSLESSCLLAKIWAINSNTIVWGFPIFSLVALSNKLISCGKLGRFLLCAMHPPPQPPNPEHTNTVLLPQRNKWKAALPSSTQPFACASLFYTWKWFIFVLLPLMFGLVFRFVGLRQKAEKLARLTDKWMTNSRNTWTDCLSLVSLFDSVSHEALFVLLLLFFSGPHHRNGRVKTDRHGRETFNGVITAHK